MLALPPRQHDTCLLLPCHRRKGHPLPASFRPRQPTHPTQTTSPRNRLATSLPPLAPRPSALHIQAAIALSELGEKRRGDIGRCDIGVQTQPVECSNKTREGAKRSSCSPGRASGSSSARKKQEAETQTKEQKRKCLTVSSQVGIAPATPLYYCRNIFNLGFHRAMVAILFSYNVKIALTSSFVIRARSWLL